MVISFVVDITYSILTFLLEMEWYHIDFSKNYIKCVYHVFSYCSFLVGTNFRGLKNSDHFMGINLFGLTTNVSFF